VRWDPSFFRKSPLYWPVAEAAAELERFDDWPAPADLTRLFSPHLGDPPVRFDLAAPKPRRRPAADDARYDARIAIEGVVPTRACSWHDLLNALVWASFPRAKRALHRRQHRMIEASLGADRRLPGARTKEQDAVAMLDEGGVAMLRGPTSCAVIFGHAIYEGLACHGPDVRGAAYVVNLDSVPSDPRARVALADAALAELLSRTEPIGRGDFEAIPIGPDLGPTREG
jgi:hypothetical protein